MARYCPSSFSVVCVYKFAKNEQGQHPAILTEQVWLLKDLGIMWLLETFFLRDTAGSPERAR